MEFTEVINNDDSLTYKTRMDLKQSKTETEKSALLLFPLYLVPAIYQLKRLIKVKQFVFY